MANFNPSNSVSFIPRKKILLTLGIISTVLFCLAPVFWQLLTSFKTNAAISTVPNIYFPSLEQLTFQHYLSLGSQFLRYIFNSAFVSIISTLLCLTLGAPAAYALTRLKLLFMGLLELIKFFHIGNNYLALIIPYTAINLPLTILILRTFFQQLPKDLEDSAKIDGYNTLSMLLNIVLPLTLPALVTTGILTFIFAWNEFIFALTFITREDLYTIPVAVAQLGGASLLEIPYGPMAAATLAGTFPLIILVLIFQRRIVQGITAGAVKG
ncbi:MAG: hypothetical protein RLZZ115_3443 [Cyanobacteriota bacterium]